MKSGWLYKILPVILAGVMSFNLASVNAFAETENSTEGGKYVSDVFIAYGKSEKKATEWLKNNGWEPVAGDFNAGKASFFDDNKIQDQDVAAVMGIHRTDDKNDAITDMAVMNMKGGYSVAEYEALLDDKKAEIQEFLNNFQVVIDEFRANYNKEGSDFGKQRADLAYDVLNKFIDGDPKDPVAVNDTGKELGKLFVEKTRQEGNKSGIDMEQIMLESSGPAMLAVETFLALGSDAGEDTWLERASGLTGEELTENLPKYAPKAAELDDIPASAAAQFLAEEYGDTAGILAEQWIDIHDTMVWFEEYNEDHDLWPYDDEDADAFSKRIDDSFAELALSKQTEEEVKAEQKKYMQAMALYYNLYEVPYSGDWGESLGDFFNPADGEDYGEEEYFLPLAAALSDGQRAALDYLSLQMLLQIGFGNQETFKLSMPDIDELLDGAPTISIYTGVKRAAFRTGVALTSEALMAQNAGKGNAYDQIWDNKGIVAISSYVSAAVGVTLLAAGIPMALKGFKYVGNPVLIEDAKWELGVAKEFLADVLKSGEKGAIKAQKAAVANAQKEPDAFKSPTTMGTAGRWMIGIGGAILVAAAVVKGIQMWKYYDRNMTPIPRMIVDESDIVTYLTDDDGKPILDEKGNQKKNIDFNTYEYYDAAHCNRPEVGEIGDWQDGVSDYKKHKCFDIADLNADMGQEWIALYTVKSASKGNPVLADSLTLQYGSKSLPKGCTKSLHLFTYTSAVDLGDTAWAFNNDKKGVYFFWDEDKTAFAEETASAFGAGQLALAGIGGLILGILGSSLVLIPRRRKEKESPVQNETTA